LIKAGQLRPVALVNEKRLPEYPDVPTMAEAGYPGIGTMAWQAMYAPSATPKEVLDTLNKAILEALDAPAVKDAFAKQGFNIVPTKSTDEAKTWIKGEMETWKKITDEVKIDLTE
jgi:tripartite-type tricarboxylate transporter receptor subunit TctC